VHLKLSGQDFQTSRAFPAVTIPAHTSVSVPLSIAIPRQAGDHPESVQLSAGDGAAASLPVARRTLIPAHGGRFSTLITSTVGRDVGQVSSYDANLPAGRRYLDVKLRAPDASADNGYTFYLVNPSGNLVDTATIPATSNGTSGGTASLYTLHPVAGLWQVDVVLDLTESGKEFTEPVYGSLADPG
jgi:hypothetical protein